MTGSGVVWQRQRGLVLRPMDAKASARSLPAMPSCPGTSSNVTLRPTMAARVIVMSLAFGCVGHGSHSLVSALIA